MKLIIEAENDAEREWKKPDGTLVLPMEFPLLKRFALTGQSVAGDVTWYEGGALALLGDLERLKRVIEWNMERTHSHAPHQ